MSQVIQAAFELAFRTHIQKWRVSAPTKILLHWKPTRDFRKGCYELGVPSHLVIDDQRSECYVQASKGPGLVKHGKREGKAVRTLRIKVEIEKAAIHCT